MFGELLKSLEAGRLPAPESLRKRLNPALVKKAGILQQPRSCWSNDPKINPEGRHLLWVAVILQDGESIGLAAGLLVQELQLMHPGASLPEIGRMVLRQLTELTGLAGNETLRRELANRIDQAAPFLPRL